MPEAKEPAQLVDQEEALDEEEMPERSIPPVVTGDAAIRPPGRIVSWWRRRSLWQKAMLVILFFGTLTVGAFFAPPEGDVNNVTGDAPASPTVAIIDQVEKITINQSFEYQGIQITILDATLATKFTDDRNRGGKYTLRVMVKTNNPSSQTLGLPYNSFFKLKGSDGSIIEPKRLSIKPQEQSNSGQTGYIDFPVETTAPLSTYAVLFDNKVSIPFGK
jgi:hypothetical protein